MVRIRGFNADRALPVEILAIIFFEGTKLEPKEKEAQNFLLYATHVSRYWRQTALSTPGLWWDVFISTCWTPRINLDRAVTWLARGKSCPVRIRSLLRGGWPPHQDEPLSDADIRTIQDHFVSNIGRIRSFVMDNRGVALPPHHILSTLKRLRDAIALNGAPWLRDISIYGSAPMVRQPTVMVNWGAVDLGSLPALQNLLLRFASLVHLPQALPNLTPDLKRLSYKRYTLLDRESPDFTGSRRLSGVDVLEIMAECRQLTHLDVSDIADHFEILAYKGSGRIVNPSIECVELSFRSAAAMVHFMRRASFPNATSMSLDVDFEATDDDARHIDMMVPSVDYQLSYLTSLHLSTVCLTVAKSILTCAPNLETLWIDGIDDWPFDNTEPPLEAIIDLLVGSVELDGDTTMFDDKDYRTPPTSPLLSAVAHPSRLPCPKLRSISIIDIEDLCIEQLLRLVDAYILERTARSAQRPRSGTPHHRSDPVFDVVHVGGLRQPPTPEQTKRLTQAVSNLELDARKWPEADDFDSYNSKTPWDFNLITF